MTVQQARTSVSQWLAEVSPELVLDENNYCALTAENGIECAIEIAPTGETLSFYAPLVHVALEAQAAMFHKALSLNLFQVETVGASIAFDRQNDFLILNLLCEIEDLDKTTFANTLNNFVDTSQKLQSAFKDISFTANKPTEQIQVQNYLNPAFMV